MNEDGKILNLDFLLRPFFTYTKSLFLFFFIILCFSTYLSFQLTEIYKSESSIVIKDKYKVLNSSESNMLSGLSALTGSGSSASTDLKIIEIAKSRDFFEELYNNKDFMLHSFAIKEYDKNEKVTIFLPEFYDKSDEYNLLKSPPFMEAYNQFIQSRIEITKDRSSGIIKISMNSKSPSSAKYLLEIVIENFVSYLTERERKNAESSYNYLLKMSIQNNPKTVDKVLAKLMEADIQITILSNSKNGLLEIIDSPYEPSRKSAPSKLTFILSLTLISFIFFYVVLIFILSAKNTK